MTQKICLVTGANSGIGKVTATALAKTGAHVAIVCRDMAKAEAAAEDIRRGAGAGAGTVEPLACDFGSMAQIRELAAEFGRRHDRLHVLVNNAGALIGTRTKSADGLELTFAANHLGYFLLTNLLLDTLKASAPARIVNVASDAHYRVKQGLDFDDLQNERRKYETFRVYSESKLANVYFTYELARRLEGTGVTANCLHPGVVGTNFGHTATWFWKTAMALGRLVLITPEEGAKTSIYLATSPDVADVSGKYFDKCKPRRTSIVSYDEAAMRRLWDVSARLTGLARTANGN